MFFNRFAGIVAAIVLIYVNLEIWHIFWLGWLILPFYFWLVSEGFESVVANHFNLMAGARAKVIGAFLALSAIGALCGTLIVFWKLTGIAMAVVLLLVGIVAAAMQSPKLSHPAGRGISGDAEEVVEIQQGKSHIVAYLIFAVLGFYFLWSAGSGAVLLSSWQTIPRQFIYAFFLAMLTLGGLIFSKFKTGTLLFLLVVQSLLLFSYLPLTHKLFWGADGWRHLASINQIVAEEPLNIKNFASGAGWAERLNPGRLSYSQFWGAEAFLGRVLDVDLIFIMSWMLPVLAGILLPVLLYEIGLALNFGRRKSLLLGWLGLWPFALQAAGSFSLPVNFGFIFFLAILLLLLKRLESPKTIQIWTLAGLFVLSIFGYALYLIMFALVWAGVEIFLRVKKNESKKVKKFALASVIIMALCVLPAVEFVAGYAAFSSKINFVNAVKQLVGNLTGYYLASGPPPHLIETGNIFFNQPPSNAFVANGFTDWRWWIPILMLFVFAFIVYGAVRLWRTRAEAGRLLVIFGACLFAGYIFSRYFIGGEHLLFRRLEALLAFFGVLFLFSAFEKSFSRKQFASMLVVLFFSIAAAASYSLGPVSRAMSMDEYNAAGFVWSEIKNDDKFCVVGDTYPLLALEAISKKRVVGGGFPIDKNFGQPELVGLFQKFSSDYRSELWDSAAVLSGASKCFFIGGKNLKIGDLPLATYGNVSVWRN
jgi:hypothetical protein